MNADFFIHPETLRRLMALNDLAHAILLAADEDGVWASVARAVQEFGYLPLIAGYDAASGTLWPLNLAGHGVPAGPSAATLPAESPVRALLAEVRAELWDQPPADLVLPLAAWLAAIGHPPLPEAEPVAIVPVAGSERTTAVLLVSGRGLTKVDLPFLQAAAQPVALGVAGIRQRQETEAVARELRQMIVDHQQLLASVREREVFLEALIDNVRDVIWWTLPDGTTLYVNTYVKSVLGYEVDELVGGQFFRFIPEIYRQRVQDAYVEKAHDAHGMGRFVLPFEAAAGKVVWLEGDGVNLRDGDQVTGRIAILRDVTEQRRLQAELVERTRRAARAEGAILSARGMAHEISQPLTMLMGYADLLLETPVLPADVRARLEKILAAAEEVAEKVRQLHATVRLEVRQFGDLAPHLDLKRSSEPE